VIYLVVVILFVQLLQAGWLISHERQLGKLPELLKVRDEAMFRRFFDEVLAALNERMDTKAEERAVGGRRTSDEAIGRKP
jgi:hypothetical protein